MSSLAFHASLKTAYLSADSYNPWFIVAVPWRSYLRCLFLP